MRIRLWGVRGSIAAPGAHTVRYGGNTTCIEVRGDDGELIILDAGTGIFPLAQSLLKELPVKANVFITHTHWDHIQGLPFFTPLYIPGNTVRIHGAYDVVTGSGIEQVMNVQLQYSYFPVREAEMRAGIEYETLTPGEAVTIGGVTVTGTLMNHPVVDLGYRVDCNGKSMFFTGDHEVWYNIYEPGDEGYEEYARLIEEKQAAVADAMRGVDVLVADCAYTIEEYPTKRGWGHGTFDSALAMARRAGVKRLVCTHHEPTRSDDDLEKVFSAAMGRYTPGPGDPEVLLAREGLEINL
jgi:phosphoribosyl 1,2-cyclic phosphodiesterase